MLENVTENRNRSLICIQYEVFDGKPVEEAFKSFCEILGDNAMEYHEFDFWFYRFVNGNYDLDYDRIKDPKKPELMDIPLDVVEMIIGKLHLKEKLSLRNVSKPLRRVVDNMKSFFDDCWLNIDAYAYSITLNNSDKWEKMKRKSWKQLLKDFVIMMNWRRMKVECLNINIDLDEQDTTHVLEAFKSLNHLIPVAKFHIIPQRADQVLAVLPYLKPGVLEGINIHSDYGSDKEHINLNGIINLDQWKQAKRCFIHHMELPIESLFHFEHIKIPDVRMSVDDVQKLKNALLASPNFEACFVSISNKDDYDAIRGAFEEEVIPIPETNQLFKSEFDGRDGVGVDFTFAFIKTAK